MESQGTWTSLLFWTLSAAGTFFLFCSYSAFAMHSFTNQTTQHTEFCGCTPVSHSWYPAFKSVCTYMFHICALKMKQTNKCTYIKYVLSYILSMCICVILFVHYCMAKSVTCGTVLLLLNVKPKSVFKMAVMCNKMPCCLGVQWKLKEPCCVHNSFTQ